MNKIAMTGASGFVGGYLTRAFAGAGDLVIPLEREDFALDSLGLAAKMGECGAVVNLAGAPIIHRWTDEYKTLMRKSRIDLTRKLVDAISVMSVRPEVLISTSAVGYYSPEGRHNEYEYAEADDFLGKLARDWEAEAMRAAEFGVRVVIFRFGIVLGPGGGALAQMVGPFKMGLGGTIGDGSQAFSWIHIDDLTTAYLRAINDTSMSGAYNLTSPNPTTNAGLTHALAHALHRPALIRVPVLALRIKYGEGASVLTSGQEVRPRRLLEAGFDFKYTDIASAVEASL